MCTLARVQPGVDVVRVGNTELPISELGEGIIAKYLTKSLSARLSFKSC